MKIRWIQRRETRGKCVRVESVLETGKSSLGACQSKIIRNRESEFNFEDAAGS